MRGVVAVTDNAWAGFLRDRPHLTEANFWTPSATAFRALSQGEPFLFKTHLPQNQLVGGGFFSGFTELTVSEAWSLFGEGNGTDSEAALAAAVARYRRSEPDVWARIGCVLLRDLFFLPADATLDPPDDFARNIVRYKGYAIDAPDNDFRPRLDLMLDSVQIRFSDDSDDLGVASLGATHGLPRLTIPRAGQQAFKGLVLTSYHRRCAVTGGKIEPTLQAAHIRPVAAQGEHRLDNGLLLRSDVHTLFDHGYLGIDEQHRLRVSPRLRSEWSNGDEFYSRAGTPIDLPDRRRDRPSPEAVTWHMDTVFRH